jgi:hypothetical protein
MTFSPVRKMLIPSILPLVPAPPVETTPHVVMPVFERVTRRKSYRFDLFGDCMLIV